MKTLNIIMPKEVYSSKNGNFNTQPEIFNEFAKHFNVNFYCDVIKGKPKTPQEPLSSKINCIDFFDGIKIKKNININTSKDNINFIAYPYQKISILCALRLRKTNLVIWIKSNPKDQFICHGNLITKPIRFIFKPIFSLFYDYISKFIFINNLVFYNSTITTDKKNHINQLEIISNSIYNRDLSLIKKEKSNKIFFIGKENNQKGLHLLLKAMQGSDKELNIIGLEKLYKKSNKKLARNVNLKFHGKIWDRKKFFNVLSRGDILVMPSFGEKSGRVSVEAMSIGLVPICADTGGVYRTAINFYNSLLFKEGDYKDLKKKINMIYSNNDLYENLKKNGLDFVNENSIQRQVQFMSKIIKNYYCK